MDFKKKIDSQIQKLENLRDGIWKIEIENFRKFSISILFIQFWMKIFDFLDQKMFKNNSKCFIQNCMKNENCEIENFRKFSITKILKFLILLINFCFFWNSLVWREGHAEHNSSIEILIVSILWKPRKYTSSPLDVPTSTNNTNSAPELQNPAHVLEGLSRPWPITMHGRADEFIARSVRIYGNSS